MLDTYCLDFKPESIKINDLEESVCAGQPYRIQLEPNNEKNIERVENGHGAQFEMEAVEKILVKAGGKMESERLTMGDGVFDRGKVENEALGQET